MQAINLGLIALTWDVLWQIWNFSKKKQKLEFTDFFFLSTNKPRNVITHKNIFQLYQEQILNKSNERFNIYVKITKIWHITPGDLDLYTRSSILACMKHF